MSGIFERAFVTLKSLVKQVLLLPIRPRVFECQLFMLRRVGLLPKRVQGQWPPERVLVVNPTHTVGDAFMMLPLLDALHRALPRAEIDLVAEPPMAGPLRNVSYLRRVFVCSPPRSKNFVVMSYLRIFAMLRFAHREFMDQSYDLALLPRWGTDPYLLTYFAAMSSAPQRCGHDPNDEEWPRLPLPSMEALLTIVSHGGKGLAEGVRQQRLLLACGFVDEIDFANEEFRPVDSAIEMGKTVDLESCMIRIGLSPTKPFVLLAPGASHPARRWPTDRFGELAKRLHQSTGAEIVTLGGASDHVLGEQIVASSCGVARNLAGKTSLLETIALMSKAKLLIANDSGPAHIGGSVGAPTLVLSACPKTSLLEHPSSPRRIRPVGPLVFVLQPDEPANGCGEWCTKQIPHCIEGISIDTAERAALRLFHKLDLQKRDCAIHSARSALLIDDKRSEKRPEPMV